MKTILLKSISIMLAVSLLSLQSLQMYAQGVSPVTIEFDESVFSFDEEFLKEKLNVLNALDAYLETNEDVTFEHLARTHSPLIADIGNSVAPSGMDGQGNEAPLGIPSFLWGCILGITGVLLVYIFSDENKDEAKKALNGCLVSIAFWSISYVILTVWVLSAENYY